VQELSFVERLSLLVDQQWNWRENQALARRLKSAKLRHNACIEDIDYGPVDWKRRHSRAERIRSGYRITRIFSFSGRPALGKASSPALSRRRRAAMDILHSTHGRLHCSAIWRWRAPTEASAICSRD
jgi:hypothetical protein